MNGNWWQVVGLLFDIGGFIIVAIDLNRDYGRYRSREQQRDALVGYKQYVAWPEFTPSGNQQLDEARREHREFVKTTTAMAIQISYWDLVREDASLAPNATLDEMAAAVEAASRAPLKEVATRPPIRFGLFLAVIGFALQLVGSWPS